VEKQERDVEQALTLRGLKKSFGSILAVDDVNLSIPKGALCGVIGPNGAGKTTTIRMIMSILYPDAGEISVLGQTTALAAKDRIGYLPEERGVYRKMKVGKFVRYVASLKGLDDTQATTRMREYFERLEIAKYENSKCEELSKGTLQKVQFTAALIHRPELLILDEPFSGLDPVSARTLRELVLEEHRRGTTILLSTHVMSHAEELCDRVVMIHRGHKVLDEEVAAIKRQFVPRTVLFEPFDSNFDSTPLTALNAVESIERKGESYKVLLKANADTRDAIQAIAAAAPPARIELLRVRLEDIFFGKVGQHSSSTDEQTQNGAQAGAAA
jgi:ABC-2 type transport system ATP-binding protein